MIFNREEKIQKIKEERKDLDLLGCTFNPEINEITAKILEKSNSMVQGMTVYDKNLLWKRKIEKNIQNNHLILERKLYKECFFEPQISKEPILLRSKTLKNDHIYKKNKEWVDKINEKRKHAIQQQEENIIKNSKMYHGKSYRLNENSIYSSKISPRKVNLTEKK